MGDFHSYNNEEEEEEVIKLPCSVEQKLKQICKNQGQNSPDDEVRGILFTIGEEGSLDILRKISICLIKKTLSEFIVFMAKKYYPSETQLFYQQQVSSAESFFHSPNSSSSSVHGPLFQPTGGSMDDFYQVNHSSALNHPKGGLPSTQSSNEALRQMGSEGKMGAVHEEMERVSRLPPSSAYATHRMLVLNKIMQLLSIQRTTSQDEELELLFSGLSLG